MQEEQTEGMRRRCMMMKMLKHPQRRRRREHRKQCRLVQNFIQLSHHQHIAHTHTSTLMLCTLFSSLCFSHPSSTSSTSASRHIINHTPLPANPPLTILILRSSYYSHYSHPLCFVLAPTEMNTISQLVRKAVAVLCPFSSSTLLSSF